MTVADHDLEMIYAHDGTERVFAGCSCGWEGETHHTSAEALNEWENHCDVVFMESTMKGGD